MVGGAVLLRRATGRVRYPLDRKGTKIYMLAKRMASSAAVGVLALGVPVLTATSASAHDQDSDITAVAFDGDVDVTNVQTSIEQDIDVDDSIAQLRGLLDF
jgi:hypothetical protein